MVVLLAHGILAATAQGACPEVPPALKPLLDQTFPEAFTSALHLGFAVGGIVLLVAAIPMALFVRQR